MRSKGRHRSCALGALTQRYSRKPQYTIFSPPRLAPAGGDRMSFGLHARARLDERPEHALLLPSPASLARGGSRRPPELRHASDLARHLAAAA